MHRVSSDIHQHDILCQGSACRISTGRLCGGKSSLEVDTIVSDNFFPFAHRRIIRVRTLRSLPVTAVPHQSTDYQENNSKE